MGKEQKSKRENKKKALLTPKEKKLAKKAKSEVKTGLKMNSPH